MTRVAVVGGGVIGLSCAYHLAKLGARVTLVERDGIGAGASSGNAGTVSVGHPPLFGPGRIGRSLRDYFNPVSPLYVRPRWDPALWRWLIDFARQCNDRRVAQYMEVMGPLGHHARKAFVRIMDEERIACGYLENGYFDVCATEAGFEGAAGEARLMEGWGYLPELVSGEDLRREEPSFAPSVTGAAFYPEACTLDPFPFLEGLAASAARLGVSVREGTAAMSLATAAGAVEGVLTSHGERLPADAVVLATGPYSLGLARRFGCRLPVQPGKGYNRELPAAGEGRSPLRISCVLRETSVICTPMGDRLRLAGTMEFSGENRVMRSARLEQLTVAASRYLPSLARAEVLSEWCGLRPMTADGLPVIGRVPGVDGLYVATGHGTLGLTLGPLTGEMVSQLVCGYGGDPRLNGLGPNRFVGVDRNGDTPGCGH